MFTINFTNSEALYEQIYKKIIEEIRQKKILPEEKLPSQRSLANHLGISVNTVRQAYSQLMDEGYIVSRERSGYFVDKLVAEDLPSWDNLIGTTSQHVLEHQSTSLKADNSRKNKSKEEPIRYDFTYSALDRTTLPKGILGKSARKAMIEIINKPLLNSSHDIKDQQALGLPHLRGKIAEYLHQQRGVMCHPDDIIVSNGYQENLRIIRHLLPDSIYGLENPGYLARNTIFNKENRTVHIPIDKYGFSVADLEQTSANIAIVTPNHQFPTGIIMGVRRSQRLLHWAEDQENRFIVEDSYDSDFKYSGRPIPSLKSLDDRGQVILSGSFSQTLTHILNIAYLVLPPQLMNRYLAIDKSLSNPSLLAQETLYQFMRNGYFYKHLNRQTTYYRKKQKLILEKLEAYPHIQILGADAGQHLVLRFPNLSDNLKSKYQEKTLREAGISLRKVSHYYDGDWPWNDYILGFGSLTLSELDEALDCLLQNCRINNLL